MKVPFLKIFCLIGCVLDLSDCANILGIFIYPFYSHQNFNHGIIKILADRGHNLTIITTHSSEYNQNTNVSQHILKTSAHFPLHNVKKSFIRYDLFLKILDFRNLQLVL
jgi:hypothetical protein